MTDSATQMGLVRKTLHLLGGNMAGQAIRLGCIPILTRLFPPEAYGQLAIATAGIMILSPLATLRYQAAIPLAETDEEAGGLALLSLCLALGVSLLAAVSAVIFTDGLCALTKMDPAVLFLVPAGLAAASGARIIEMLALRGQRFRLLAVSSVAGAAVSRIVIVGLGLLGAVRPAVLVSMKPVQDLSGLCVLLAKGFPAATFSPRAWRAVPVVLRRYAVFARYSLTDLFMMLSRELPTVLMGIFFTPAIIGLYALSKRAFNEPSFVIGDAVTRALYQDLAARRRDKAPLAPNFLATVRQMAVLCLFPSVVLALYGEGIFATVFGARWAEAGGYLPQLLPLFAATFISLPSNALYDALEEQRVKFILSMAFTAAVLAGFLLGVPSGDIHLTLLSFSSCGAVVLMVKLAWILNRIGALRLGLAKALLPAAAGAAAMSAALLAMDRAVGHPAAKAGIAGLLLVAYFAWNHRNLLRRPAP